MKKFINWIILKAFNSKMRDVIKETIIKCYQQVAKDTFNVKSQIIQVKKGKRKYQILFLETPKGLMKFTLKRHWEKYPQVS